MVRVLAGVSVLLGVTRSTRVLGMAMATGGEVASRRDAGGASGWTGTRGGSGATGKKNTRISLQLKDNCQLKVNLKYIHFRSSLADTERFTS